MTNKIALTGKYVLEITSADHILLLNAVNEGGIVLQDMVRCGDLTMRVTVNKVDYPILLKVAERQGASVHILRRIGLYWFAVTWFKRPLLPILSCLLLLTACYIPSRVLFVAVEGNPSVPTNLILDEADACGIRFGASRRLVRSEVIKNKLLQQIPQLQWAGINTNGCVAVIRVQEKPEPTKETELPGQVCSIVASRDGVILSCVVRKGNPLCLVGQAVKSGETLVSGYTDCGIVTTATKADAEIRALTFREIDVVSPHPVSKRGGLRNKKTAYSLQIGKKLIKFYKDSGISHATCAKIYVEKCLQLPGGFTLPIKIIQETFLYYDEIPADTQTDGKNDWLELYAQNHLKSVMVAGEIISAQTDVSCSEHGYHLSGKYACIEMIGQVKPEQTIIKDDKHD